jgi:hypothetical protein
MGALLADLVRWVFDVVHSFGYAGVLFVLILAGSLFMPVPTELTLPLIGFLVGHGRLSFFPVLITATAARVSASLILYAIGLRIREARLRRVVKRFERSRLVFRVRPRRGEQGLRAPRGEGDPGGTPDPRRRRPGLGTRWPQAHAPALAFPWLHRPRMHAVERHPDQPGMGPRRPLEDRGGVHFLRRARGPDLADRRNPLLLAAAKGTRVGRTT